MFSRATSQNSCLHETFATDTISSRIREVYFISFMQVRSKVLLWGSPILCLLTVIQQLFYNADRKRSEKGDGMERTKIEQLFENYSFWRHLSEEEKKMLQKQIRWCTYEEGRWSRTQEETV